jgi:molybdate transport system permease protein
MLSPEEWLAVEVTLQLCLSTTLILLVIATPLAWWLAGGSSLARNLVQTLVALPLVLPPTVLGFYLLILLGPSGPIGRAMEALGMTHLAFRVVFPAFCGAALA